ncbi:MAG: hypothetical protein IT379_37425 [Deltaproteobacteria bacterium]|nr:hypothetical protein [Deltaproteobacteria bacterium]
MPSPTAGVSDAHGIAVGSSFACVRRRSATGPVACWGSNDHGQLGDGTTQPRADARDVALP